VFLAVLFTSARHGGQEARLEVADLARLTGLGERTVQAALTQLLRQGLLIREGRYRRLKVQLGEMQQPSRGADELVSSCADTTSSGGASLSAPPKRKLVCASPTCLDVSINKETGREGTFTARQRNLIAEVFTESSELLGSDVTDLCLASGHAERLGLPAGVTYGQAQMIIAESNDARKARDFTRTVLALRHDTRVQGEELDLSINRDEASNATCQ
jgi:hypothetical protein